MLHMLAKTYGGRPSAWAGVEDDVGALTVDLAALEAGCKAEADANDRARERARRRGRR